MYVLNCYNIVPLLVRDLTNPIVCNLGKGKDTDEPLIYNLGLAIGPWVI